MLTKHYLNLIALTRHGQTLSTLDGNTGVVSDRLQSSGRAGKESKVVSSNPSVQYSGKVLVSAFALGSKCYLKAFSSLCGLALSARRPPFLLRARIQ